MTDKQLIAEALLVLGEGDQAEALKILKEAESEAQRVDPEGLRVAEVLEQAVQLHAKAGRQEEARAIMERVGAIWERYPEKSTELMSYYLDLMGRSLRSGDQALADAWRRKALALRKSGQPRR